jgi:hypothetical protein
MAGGRYDNYRMCVASPAGVKGGAMADIMFTTKHRLNDHRSLTFNLPVMRPVLFGLAFKREGVVKSVVGLKAFYIPFFAKDRSPGTVQGGALLYTYYLR